ncbi:D-cysteine desulfhydrase family protein [Luteibacter aegosomatissinici]|uniref:D-cysteine desulfhydrase family protein n=1 Tax=Luteibacter aegosomatissinici TaxID=2911539 RepID=UPI001FFBC340|nr:D-cysteine desulfhydrase family protein [Luteibacter aegosomatissinici]UPG94198.1 D-cysteine desulfhydrase family protein [Luteibacter aegosomatissinici]
MGAASLSTLDAIPRVDLLDGPTPIQRLERIERALGLADRGIRLYAKRDDLMSLGGGGNKLRKLEYHLGGALADGVDTVVSVGGVQSNHARLTAAAAARLGLACELFLARMVPRDGTDYERNGNVLLDDLFNARPSILAPGENALEHANARAQALRAAGHTVLVLPTGGSTPLGALGYARCAREIAQQEAQRGLRFDRVIVPNGSAGTQAGLVAGYAAMGRDTRSVRAYAVLAAEDRARETARDLANAALGLLGKEGTLTAGDIEVDGGELGDGYGVPTDAMVAAVRLMASQEGVLLDPVYSGKAFAGLLRDLRCGVVREGEDVLFVVTGGTPGLFAYREVFA